MRLKTDRAMLAAPFLFVLLWSSSFITAKAGLRYLSPLLFVAIRLVACAVVLTVLMLLLRQSWRPLAVRKWLHCAIAGALLNAIGLMAPHVGLLTAPAAQIAIVQSLTPLLTAILGMMLLRERLRMGQWLGLTLGRRWRRARGRRGCTGKPRAVPRARAGVRRRAGPRCGNALFRTVLPWCPSATRSYGAVPVSRRCGLAGGVATGNASCRLDGDCCRSRCVEHRHGFSGRYGPLLRHACSRHRRPRQCELLSCSRHGGAACLAAPRRAA